jgi:hypothetical protein
MRGMDVVLQDNLLSEMVEAKRRQPDSKLVDGAIISAPGLGFRFSLRRHMSD